jgi:hypothetical protein
MKSRKSSSKSPAPPPAFAGTRLIAYAILDTSIPYAGRGYIFAEGKALGRVPKLALTRSGAETFVVYCSKAWRVRAMFGYPSVGEAKRSAQRHYPGVSRRWRRVYVTQRQVERYLRAVWKGLECSFCDRRPDQFETMVGPRGRGVRICDICVREFGRVMNVGWPATAQTQRLKPKAQSR